MNQISLYESYNLVIDYVEVNIFFENNDLKLWTPIFVQRDYNFVLFEVNPDINASPSFSCKLVSKDIKFTPKYAEDLYKTITLNVKQNAIID